MATSKWLPLLLLFGAASAWGREAALPANCAAAGSSAPISAAKTSLAANASDLYARFKLADAWSDSGCFGDALQVLEAGQALNPRSTELEARIRVARSVVSEQTYFDKLDQVQQEAKLSRATFRCSKLAELSSCDDALTMRPNDSTVLMAKADALMQAKRSGEAIGVYRRIAAGAANHDAVGAKLAAAESLRHTQVEICQSKDGEAAERACGFGLLPGAADEVVMLKRRGSLLQHLNQPDAALDAYLGAGRLKPDDAVVAAAIVSLSDSTGRNDPETLTARGEALVALGRSTEAIAPLTQALKLQPGSSKAKNDLRIAQRAAKQRRRAAKQAPYAAKPVPIVEEHHEAVAANDASHYSNDAPATRSN